MPDNDPLDGDTVEFGTLGPEGLTNVRRIPRARILRCPQFILLAEHYPEEGEAADTCLCYVGHGGEYVEDPTTGAFTWKPYDGPHGWDEEPEEDDTVELDPDAMYDLLHDEPEEYGSFGGRLYRRHDDD